MIFLARLMTIFMSLLTFLGGFLGIEVNLVHQKVDKFDVSSYIVSSYVQSENALRSEDFDVITNAILFGCATFDNQGNVNLDREILETALANLRKAIGDRDVAITLNILGPGGHTDSTVWEDQMEAQSEEHNKAFNSGVFEDNIIAVLDEYGFDGIHFDYEHPLSTNAWNNFNKFLVKLDKKLGDYTLGVAICDWNLKFTTLAYEAVDYIELMLYDIYDEEGRHSTFETAAECARKACLSGAPREKIRFGTPFYARPSDRDAYWYSYTDYYDKLDENNWYYDENIGKSFWFNTPDVIEKKTDYAINYGYGGVMIWHYTCDIPMSSDASLLAAIDRAIDANY